MKPYVYKIQLFLLLSVASMGVQAQSTIDYSQHKNWAVTPETYPESLKQLIVDTTFTKTDVFYVYPTLYTDYKDTAWNIDIDNLKQREKILNIAVKNQASAWANAGQVYVPYYRQAHIRSYSKLEGRGRDALLLAYADVKAAFEYYLKHYNNGRAIILAGHSQGSTHLSMLLKDYFDNKPLQEKLVAAYLPGIGLEKTQYKSIHLMSHPDSTGGFVTWNTFKKKYKTGQYVKWYKGKASINPVTWDSTIIASKSLHKGFLYSNGKLYSKSFETHLIDGGVWITTPHFPSRLLSFTMKNYHIGDVNLFWEDIHLNARNRATHYWNDQVP
ncbi:MAG: hypothetical protein ACI9JN_000340 [Bacteroidia bacterium]|jgi:hypothetical protein